MAFATSNVKLRSIGDSWRLTGEWTAANGDTSGTVSVGGARVHELEFTNQDGNTGVNTRLESSVSTNSTTGISTVTVSLAGKSVTNGRFSITYN